MSNSITGTTETKVQIDALSTDEKTQAANLIKRMHVAQKSFIQLGHAILEFKTAKLYRETHDTVEAWCKDVLDMDAKTARRLVNAAKVCSHLMIEGYNYKSTIKTLPINEGQARVLTTFLNDDNEFIYEAAIDIENPANTDIMITCYDGMLTLHNSENAVLKAAGAKLKRLTANWMETYRKENYPTVKEQEKAVERKAALEQKKKDAVEKAKTDAEGNEAGTTGIETGDVTGTDNAAQLLEITQAELDDAQEEVQALSAAMRTLQTESREAKQAVKIAGGLKDSKFIRVSLAIGMAQAMKAAQESGDTALIQEYAKEMLTINETFKTIGLTTKDLF